LVMHPAQSLETWWDCTNPMPELAGLHAVTERLLQLPPKKSSAAERTFWQAFAKKLPPLPTRQLGGVEMLAPADQFANKRNIENPELYAVFPFRLVAFEKANARLGLEALKQRTDRGNRGWRQDDIFMAYLGLADQAWHNVVGRARNKDPRSRFPAFWGPNYDWVPDQDHGGVLMKAVQAMLLQTDGRKIYLLPAWPQGWDVDFKLHAPYQTVVQATVRGDKVVRLKVTPAARRSDIVACGEFALRKTALARRRSPDRVAAPTVGLPKHDRLARPLQSN
jgi:alpha-L-fucosidase 2